jgi:hypothetical protein
MDSHSNEELFYQFQVSEAIRPLNEVEFRLVVTD